MPAQKSERSHVRTVLNQVIFGYEAGPGRIFDVTLIIVILLSVLAAILDSVQGINALYHDVLYSLEWLFTILFTIEYILRLYSTNSIRQYVFSFYGLVDLFSILPTYLTLLHPEASYLIVIRVLRVMRIFRILKLMRYIEDANLLVRSLFNARRKILVFLISVMSLNVVFGSLMFIVEGPDNGFSSIPISIYWSIVTVTTVGYGDIAPQSELGRFIAALAMLTGYAIIAVPTGIVSSEMVNEYALQRRRDSHDYTIECTGCTRKGHDRDARYCKQCGASLPENTRED
jgi:voltage-gated potassium channel